MVAVAVVVTILVVPELPVAVEVEEEVVEELANIARSLRWNVVEPEQQLWSAPQQKVSGVPALTTHCVSTVPPLSLPPAAALQTVFETSGFVSVQFWYSGMGNEDLETCYGMGRTTVRRVPC